MYIIKTASKTYVPRDNAVNEPEKLKIAIPRHKKTKSEAMPRIAVNTKNEESCTKKIYANTCNCRN